jgi:hypothetical protein
MPLMFLRSRAEDPSSAGCVIPLRYQWCALSSSCSAAAITLPLPSVVCGVQGHSICVCHHGTLSRWRVGPCPAGADCGVCVCGGQDDDHELVLSDHGKYLAEDANILKALRKNMELMLEIDSATRHFFLRADMRYAPRCVRVLRRQRSPTVASLCFYAFVYVCACVLAGVCVSVLLRCSATRDRWIAGLQLLCGMPNTVEWPLQFGELRRRRCYVMMLARLVSSRLVSCHVRRGAAVRRHARCHRPGSTCPSRLRRRHILASQQGRHQRHARDARGHRRASERRRRLRGRSRAPQRQVTTSSLWVDVRPRCGASLVVHGGRAGRRSCCRASTPWRWTPRWRMTTSGSGARPGRASAASSPRYPAPRASRRTARTVKRRCGDEQCDPVVSCPVLSCPVVSCRVPSCPVVSCRALSCRCCFAASHAREARSAYRVTCLSVLWPADRRHSVGAECGGGNTPGGARACTCAATWWQRRVEATPRQRRRAPVGQQAERRGQGRGGRCGGRRRCATPTGTWTRAARRR